MLVKLYLIENSIFEIEINKQLCFYNDTCIKTLVNRLKNIYFSTSLSSASVVCRTSFNNHYDVETFKTIYVYETEYADLDDFFTNFVDDLYKTHPELLI